MPFYSNAAIAAFDVTPQIAAQALNYLIEKRPDDCIIEIDGVTQKYIGWGERAVWKIGDRYELKSFRRFEYRMLDNLRDDSVSVTAAFSAFRSLAIKNRKEKENEED